MTDSAPKVRLDQLLVDRGDASTREKAQRMVRAGQVRLATEVLDKPGRKIAADAPLDVRALHDAFVSRGGLKLDAAFGAFAGLTPCPAVCADIGASTGGFTDCLLQHGARRVYAIDVGTGQLDGALRQDARVVVMEGVNARYLKPGDLPEPVELVVSDVSFISLRLVLPPAVGLLRPGAGQAVVLVKPQFEAGPENVGRGGVVRDPAVHRAVLQSVAMDLPGRIAMSVAGLVPSPVRGPAGNREYLLWLVRAGDPRGAGLDVPAIGRAVEAAFEII